MRILVLYQHIDSGAMVATEALLSCLKETYPKHVYILYRQQTYRYTGAFSFLRNLCRSINDFRTVIRQTRPDLVYATVYTAIIAQKFSVGENIPSVFHLHGDHRFGGFKQRNFFLDIPRYMYTSILEHCVLFLQKHAVQRSSNTIFVSNFAKEEFVSRYHLESFHPKFHVIYNGVSLDKYTPVSDQDKKDLKKKYRIPSTNVITYIGRIDEKKGIHHLLHAVNNIKQEGVSTLIIYPETKDEHSHQYFKLLQCIAKKSTHPVQFMKNPTKLHEFYQLSDCVVLPSEQEMLPLVMLESLASGVPFLCTSVGGVQEVLRDFPLFLLESVEPSSLAMRIQGILGLDKKNRKAISEQERALAEQYSWERAAKEVQHVFEMTTRYS